MAELIYFVITFFLIYLLYYILIIRRKKSLEKFKKSTEVVYLERRYLLNVQKVDIKKLARTIAFSNSLLISLTVFLVSVLDNIVTMVVVSALIMIPMILVTYHIIGTHFKKKEKR